MPASLKARPAWYRKKVGVGTTVHLPATGDKTVFTEGATPHAGFSVSSLQSTLIRRSPKRETDFNFTSFSGPDKGECD